jgi:hypothetical protein
MNVKERATRELGSLGHSELLLVLPDTFVKR